VFRGEPDLRLAKILDEDCQEALLHSPLMARSGKDASIAPQVDFSQIGRVDYTLMGAVGYCPHAWGQKVSQYLSSLVGSKVALMEGSRGCSFDCPFCLRTGFRNRYRLKPIETLEDELDQLTKLGVRYVYFIDETFGLSWKFTQRVIQLLCQRGIKYGMQTRPDILTDEKISDLESTGCVYVELGVEANERDRLAKLGKFYDPNAVFPKIAKLRRVIPFVNNNILDLINEDYMHEADITFASQVDNSGNPPPPFMPYPTTHFGEQAINHYRGTKEPVWEVGEDLYILYSLISRYSIARHILLRRRSHRQLVRQVIRCIKRLHIAISVLGQSRFEVLYRQKVNTRKRIGMVQAVLFDLGGVILRTEDLTPRRKWEQRLSLPEGELKRIVLDNPVSQRAAVGQADAADVWTEVAHQLSLSPVELSELEQDFWRGDVYDLNLLAFIRSLRPRFKTGLVCNSWPIMRKSAQEYLDNSIFDILVFSDEEGFAKPGPEIYRCALTRLHILDAAQAIFVDDSLANVEGARAVGMLGIHFRDPEQASAEINQFLRE
jgi:putative hydrolase of the HAD superfamily